MTALPAAEETSRDEWLVRIRRSMARGEYLLAYDDALAGSACYPDDVALRHHVVLTLARTGATDRAYEQWEAFGFEGRALAGEPADLVEDVAALQARLAKDRALAVSGRERRARARLAATLYEEIYRSLGRPYSCINAATMWLLSGDVERSAALARSAWDLCRAIAPASSEDAYWTAATEAEAALLLDDPPAATDALRRAVAAEAADVAKRSTTRKQLVLVCAAKAIDPAVLAALAIPKVIHYCGHMIEPPGQPGRFPAEAEPAIAMQIDHHLDGDDVGFGYGSLACGADILFAEALLSRGAEVHVVLPFAVEEFRRISVATGGESWAHRFDECLSRVASVSFTTQGEYLDDPALFDYCARIGMGQALIRSAFLCAEVEQVAVWDGRAALGNVGTGTDIDTWQRGGRKTHVLPVIGGEPSRSAPRQAPSSRALRAMLFADVKGFSKLVDSQVPDFLRHVMRPLADTLDTFDDQILHRNSWGDGLYVVFREVAAAARCALALQDTVKSLDPPSVGLPPALGLRIAAHAGPVFEAEDPVRREVNFYGVEVTRTARIEPRTPEGNVYVTDAFAALAALECEQDLTCQYVGHIPTAKDYGIFPMYVLKRRG